MVISSAPALKLCHQLKHSTVAALARQSVKANEPASNYMQILFEYIPSFAVYTQRRFMAILAFISITQITTPKHTPDSY